MSGEAGATRRSRYYLVQYSSGTIESIEPPPWEDDPAGYVSEAFQEMSLPYEKILNKVVPLLDEYFEKAEQLYPLAAIDGDNEWIYGVIIEDTDEKKRNKHEEKHGRNWLINSRKKGAFVGFSVPVTSDDLDIVEITVAVTEQIRRSIIESIQKDIREIFLEVLAKERE